MCDAGIFRLGFVCCAAKVRPALAARAFARCASQWLASTHRLTHGSIGKRRTSCAPPYGSGFFLERARVELDRLLKSFDEDLCRSIQKNQE